MIFQSIHIDGYLNFNFGKYSAVYTVAKNVNLKLGISDGMHILKTLAIFK